jgi:circadian clock protein KaiC
MSETKEECHLPLVASGTAGLDHVLAGGFTPHRVYLIEGNPGSGKTTLSLKWLLDGQRAGETCMYVTLSETKAELTAVAHSHGWSLVNRTRPAIRVCEAVSRLGAC